MSVPMVGDDARPAIAGRSGVACGGGRCESRVPSFRREVRRSSLRPTMRPEGPAGSKYYNGFPRQFPGVGDPPYLGGETSKGRRRPRRDPARIGPGRETGNPPCRRDRGSVACGGSSGSRGGLFARGQWGRSPPHSLFGGRLLIGTLAEQDHQEGLADDPQVSGQRPVLRRSRDPARPCGRSPLRSGRRPARAP